MPHTTLPTFASFVLTNGSPKVTAVRNAQRASVARDYAAVDHYIHLRRPLNEAFYAGGDPAPLHDVLLRLKDPKKYASHKAVVDGLSRYFRTVSFTALPVRKRAWSHGGLTVSVTPTVRLQIGDDWHVAYVHLKQDPLSARTVAPVLELIEQTHGRLGTPLVIDARAGRAHSPSRSPQIRRGLGALLEAEALAFVQLWNSIGAVA